MLSGKLTLMMLCTFPILIGVAVFFGKFIRKIATQAQDKLADTNTVVEETLQAITTVKSFANEWYEAARYRKSMLEVVHLATRSAIYRGAFAAFFIFVVSGGIVAIIWVGATMVNDNTLKLDALMSFILYSAFVGGSMASFADLYAQIQKTVGATQRVFELLDTEIETINLQKPSEITAATSTLGNVAVRDVTFHYPSRPADNVLQSISFDVKQGEKIALVGTSGAGKTTITNLLLRLYEVSGGEICIDDKPLTAYPLTDLRRQIAIVPQDVVLFGTTIYDNIAYGNPNATPQAVYDAAHSAFATEFIEAIPEKYQALVGERGIKLSGGQRQRIAIARAILRNPKILILDEATSALDSQSELMVQKALDNLMQSRTSIIIAHRLSTIRHADKIAVIDQGKIAEFGTHSQLMQIDNGIYKQLKGLQIANN
jgi:ABC-type multidrug transport system fused ATPase/permease subunit